MKIEKRAVWEERVARWAQTGWSRSEFAAHEGVSPQALSNWKWEFSRKPAAPRSNKIQREAKLRFVEIARSDRSAPAKAVSVSAALGADGANQESRFELIVKNDVRVLLPHDFEERHLRRLMGVLGEAQ